METHNIQAMAVTGARETESRFISKVYGWMTGALLLTAFVAAYVVATPTVWKTLVGNQAVFIGLIIAELGLVMYLSFAINKMSAMTATIAFLAYSALNGLTLSVIFMAFTMESIASTFFITAATFGVMSIYGYVTKKDLTSLGNLFFMWLMGIIIASVVNIFLKSTAIYWITTYIGILVFVGLTAYDTQKIKQMAPAMRDGTDIERKGSIMGALALYLDFINLFLLLLRLFGRRR